LEEGRVEADLAKVRFDHYASKRKAKLIAINQQLQNINVNQLMGKYQFFKLNNFLGSPDKRSARGGGGQPNSELALHLQKAPFFSVQHSPKQQPRKVLFITGIDAGMSLSKSKHDLKGGSPNTM